MAVGPITLIMIKHHAKINQLLIDFEKTSEEDSEYKRIFEKFRKKIDKHFFIEELNIFPVSDSKNPKEVLRLKNLVKDHQDLREIVRGMEEEIADGRKPKTTILRELLYAHEEREVVGFYPLLDERLPIKEKKNIVDDINEEKF
ncbi:MAG: hemerythrin domain-containing protein [Candidatus Pacearchaeota archaeon]